MILEQRAGRGVSHHETVERGGDGKVATIRDARDPGAAETLRGARARFLGTGGGPERVPDLDGVPREVSAAWRRALFYEVPPDLPAPPPAPAPTGSALLEAARPVLERLAPAARQAGFRLLLADAACRVLWSSAAGEPYDLSEESVGHNSVAAALRTGRRAEVSGPEHVLEIWQETDALSVPVLDRTGGHAVGAVTAVTAVRRLGPVETACAEAAALAVEAEFARRRPSPEQVLLDAYLAQRPERCAVVATDGRTRLVSGPAARLLSGAALEAIEREAARLVREGGAGAEAPATLDLPHGGPVARVRPVPAGEAVIGVVAVVPASPAGPVVPAARAADRLPGLRGLVGDSLPWRSAVEAAGALARSPAPLLVSGEPGAGKTALARAVAAARDRVPEEFDAARSTPERAAEWVRALDGGRMVLLRHTEALAPAAAAALVARLEEGADIGLIATATLSAEGAGPCLRRLLDRLSARRVEVPPLRERPEDIPALLRALTPPPGPGRPPLAWSVAARRALERYDWPGNVAELAALAAALAGGRRLTGAVRREELPDAVRNAPGKRRLTGLERAERSAIQQALHTHGGNRLRAAGALGIGRATLYRKLRAFGLEEFS